MREADAVRGGRARGRPEPLVRLAANFSGEKSGNEPRMSLQGPLASPA